MVRSRGKRTMRTAAAATAAAASCSAQDWGEQSRADSRRRHAENDAHSLCDHCRPPFAGDKSNYRSRLASVFVLARRDCGSAARPPQAIVRPPTV
jgi:hypothetical protein